MPIRTQIKVADETWVATALLHRENPDRLDFSVREIVDRARRAGITSELRPGVEVHVRLQCVANLRPNPGRYRMLFATGKARRRLFRVGDPFHPDRHKGKIAPEKDELPEQYHPLVDWYFKEYARTSRRQDPKDSILALVGCGAEVWQDEDSDTYVRRLREGWK